MQVLQPTAGLRLNAKPADLLKNDGGMATPPSLSRVTVGFHYVLSQTYWVFSPTADRSADKQLTMLIDP